MQVQNGMEIPFARSKPHVTLRLCVAGASIGVLQTVNVFVTVKKQRLLHLRHVRFMNIVLYVFRVSSKMPPPGEKLFGGTKDMSTSSTLLKNFNKLTKRFHIHCIKHIIVTVFKVLLVVHILRRVSQKRVNALGQIFAPLRFVRLVKILKIIIVDATDRFNCLQQCFLLGNRHW